MVFCAPMVIGTEDVDAASGETFVRMDPISGCVVTKAAAAAPSDVKRAIDAAEAAFVDWSRKGPHTKRRILNDCADALADHTTDFVRIGIAETGATKAWIRANVERSVLQLREAAASTTFIRGQTIPAEKQDCHALAIREPLGVVAAIAPWNAPITLAVRSFAMAVACGNTVVMKSSEKCPGLHRMIALAMLEGGLPPGVLNVISHAPADGPGIVNTLVADPRIRHINFTGSTRVGRIIAEKAGRYLKPCLLELGGKSALIVLDDADIEGAVRAAVFGSFGNQGQICMSTERVIVDASVADAFVAAFASRAASLRADVPDAHTPLAGVIDHDVVGKLHDLVDDAVAKGATLVCGGVPETGVIMQPTILDHVTPDMAIFREESFGPITSVIRAQGADQAVSIANDSEFGLSAAVHGRDVARALGVARQLKTGMAHVNGATVYDEPQMPFGGMKDSGYGRFGTSSSIEAFTELRWITVESATQLFPI